MEFRYDPHRAQRILQHSAASGAELDQAHILGRAHLLPNGRRPQPDKFTEHLAHFRRRDEVATRAERVTRGVVTMLAIEQRSEEHTSELQSRRDLVCRLLLEKKKRHAEIVQAE